MPEFKAASDVRLPRLTKGKRPSFFEDQSSDQLMTFILELMTEVMVLRDRQDTLERLLERGGAVNREELRRYVPDAGAEAERNADRAALIERVLRIHVPEGRQDA